MKITVRPLTTLPKSQSLHGKPTWGVETIRRILQDEKYKGHGLLQETYVSNFFTGKRTNNGVELTKYLIKGHHEAIITPEEILTF